jgi:hypothetical protein
MEIETNSRTLATTPSIIQLIATTKPLNPLKGGTCLEITPLLFQNCTHLGYYLLLLNLWKGVTSLLRIG